jgi:glutaredoxin
MKLKIFTKPSCPACPPAKELGKKLKDKTKVEFFDISKANGLAEAAHYDVMSTPTIVLVDNKGKEKKTWITPPSEKEILKEL